MSAASPGSDRALLAVAIGLAVATVAAFWVVGYLPTNDGPDHVFAGWLENHWGELAELDRERVVMHAQLTAHGFRVLFVPLERWLGWRDALRATESIWALTFSLAVMAFVWAAAPRRRWLGLLGFPASFQWSLYMGFFSFWAASAFGLFVLALALRRERLRPIDRFLLAALLFLTAMLHAFPALLVGATLAAIALARVPLEPAPIRREVALLGLMGLPAALVVVLTSLAPQGEATAVDSSTLLSRATLAGQAFAVGPAWRAAPFFALALLGYGAALARLDARPRTERVLALIGAGCLLAAVLSPVHLLHWQFFSPRFLVLGVVFGLPLVEIERLGSRSARFVELGLSLFAAVAVVWSMGFHRRLGEACAPALAGLEAHVPRSGFTVFLPLSSCFSESPVEHVPYVPRATPLWKTAAFYAIEQGGIANTLNGIRELHSFSLIYGPIDQQLFDGDWARRWTETVLAPGPVSPERNRERFALVTRLAEIGATNDHLVVYGTPEHRRLVLDRGFRVDWENDRLSLAHFVGCPLELELPPGWASPLVEYGWWPHDAPFVRFRSRATAGASTQVTLPRTPCGPIWIRVMTEDGRYCAGADREGRVFTRSGPGPGTYRCAAP